MYNVIEISVFWCCAVLTMKLEKISENSKPEDPFSYYLINKYLNTKVVSLYL